MIEIEKVYIVEDVDWIIGQINSSFFKPYIETVGADEYYYIVDDDIPVGLGFIRGWESKWDEKILGIGITEWHRGKGYALHLLNHLELVAKKRGLTSLRLHVHPGNYRAKRLYHKHGWKHEAERSDGEEIWRKKLT